jgi:O-antigen ligase
MNNSLTMFLVNTKSILFGAGYMISNPHNEVIRVLSNSGLFGLLSYILYVISIIFNI